MSALFTHIRRFDWLLMGAVLLLIAIGLTSLFSLSGIRATHFFERQLVWAGVGIILLIGSSMVDFRIFRTQTAAVIALYALAILLLAAVLIVSPRVRGIRAWLQIGGVALQPVELAKLSLAVLLAKFFSKRHIEIYRIRHLIVSGLYLVLPMLLVMLQPDPGSAVVLIAIWVAAVLFSGMRLRHFFYLLAVGIATASIAWFFVLLPYQKARITSFLDPYRDPQGAGYQMIQSMIAVGSGRVWGKGLGYGSQSHLHFLPEPHADFIFAAYTEEWGFVGSTLLLGLIGAVIWRIIHIGSRARDNFSRIYTIGFAAFIFSQSFIHIGMNMGLLPITGITLPFVSYGGSSLVTLMIGVGIVQNIHINARREVE
mgnify:CR=1 FL=1